MSPYLILGVIAAGALHVLLPMGIVSKHLGTSGFGSVLRAAILGIPLPICSCGVVPVAASLKKEGAGTGATISFLVTTPTTGVDSILATYSLLGLPLAIARTVAALVLGIIAGVLSNLGNSKSDNDTGAKKPAAEKDSHNHKQHRISETIRYAFYEIFAGIARPLLIGVLLGGAVSFFIPEDFIALHIRTGFAPYLIMMSIGIPLYVCASGSIPFAAALLIKGISPGAALVFLIAGPATNIATITIISSMLGKRTTAIYLAVLMLGSLGAGIATDAVLAALPDSSLNVAAQINHNGLSLMELASGSLVSLAMLYFGIQGIKTRLTRPTTPS